MLMELRNLTVAFPAGRDRRDGLVSAGLVAVRDVSLTLAAGEVLGLVGESGSGKSVTSLALMGLLPEQAQISGEILFADAGGVRDLRRRSEEEMRRLRGAHISMIFQEPMTALNPVMRVGEQVAEAVRAHHPELSKAEARQRAIAALREVAIPEPEERARDYPHQLSGGQRQRVMIAIALVNRPQLLIADEPTTALDVTIQAQILELLAELRQRLGLAMLFISHDLAVVSQVADRVAVMYAGSVVEMGTRAQVFTRPAHPYTDGLLRSAPSLRTERGRPLSTIEGSVPPLAALPPGCAFEPRCEFREAECTRTLPSLVEVRPGHWARCPVRNPAAGL